MIIRYLDPWGNLKLHKALKHDPRIWCQGFIAAGAPNTLKQSPTTLHPNTLNP